MKMLVIENLKTGEADCEPYIPMPGQIDLEKCRHLKCHKVDSQLLALSYLDRSQDLKIDNEAIKSKIIRALELSDWVQKDAAKLLGITPKAIWDRIRKYNIMHPDGKWFQKDGRKPKFKVMRGKAA